MREKIDMAVEGLLKAAEEIKAYRACREEQDETVKCWHKAVVLEVLGIEANGINSDRIERLHADEEPAEQGPIVLLYCGGKLLMRFMMDSNMVRRVRRKETFSVFWWEALRALDGVEYWAEIYEGSDHWMVVPEETRRKMRWKQRIKCGKRS